MRGRLGDGLVDAFDPLVPIVSEGRTVLCGVIEDQAALQGVLARIQSFGLELDEVRRVAATSGRLAGHPTPEVL